jgi:hypothetical protein
MNRRIHLSLLVAVAALAIGCSPVHRLLPQEELLTRVSVVVDGKPTSDEAYAEVIQQWPNRSLLGWKAYLALYNLPKRESDKPLAKWFRRIGEAPVVLDPVKSGKTLRQLEHVAQNAGYLRAHAEVRYTPGKKKQRVGIQYLLHRGPRFTLGNRVYTFYSPALEEANRSHPLEAGSLLQPGSTLLSATLDAERSRISSVLRDLGFFSMGPELVRIQIDTLQTPGVAHLEIVLEDRYANTPDGLVVTPHRVRTMGTITVFPDYRYTGGLPVGRPLDPTGSGVRQMQSDGRLLFAPERLNEWVIPRSKMPFRASDLEGTIKRLSDFPVVQSAEWRFSDARGDTLNADLLVVRAPSVRFFFRTEGTTTSGLYGIGGTVGLGHNNVWGGAERWELRLNGALSAQAVSGDQQSFFNTAEWGLESSLYWPRLWGWPAAWRSAKHGFATTEARINANRQQRPEFARQTFGTRFLYDWRSSPRAQHTLTVLDVAYIHLLNADPDYVNSLLFKTGFQNTLIAASSYRLQWSPPTRKSIQKSLTWTVESAGSGLDAARRLSPNPWNQTEGAYTLANVPYAHYLRAELDARYKWQRRGSRQWAFRGLVGLAYTLANTPGLPPFEKSFFAGGSNDLRAWPAYRLGPGAFPAAVYDTLRYVSTGPAKILGSAEYRFKVASSLYGAVFLDLGNTWLLPRNQQTFLGLLSHPDIAPLVVLSPRTFLAQMAVGSGIGIRYDFSFFVVRADWGIRLWDPSEPLTDRLVVADFRWKKTALNVGIGYPF